MRRWLRLHRPAILVMFASKKASGTMLTRLKVSGFKNLVDVDVRFGPFTCIAGANGVGKSNLFDAIRFLSALADQSLIEAAQSVRDEEGDIRNLFHKVGDTYADEMSFEAEMIIPREGEDDLNQPAIATITFLRYKIAIRYETNKRLPSAGSLIILGEELVHFKKGDTEDNLLFEHGVIWRESAVRGQRRSSFISTTDENGEIIIQLHQDGGSKKNRDRRSRGRPRKFLASTLPRTVLSSTNAMENPTALLARREMQSWRLLQLEPSALRKPDRFTDPGRLKANGEHMPATIERLANRQIEGQTREETRGQVYSEIANRLSELIANAGDIYIDQDEGRQRLTLYLRHTDGTTHPAHALSDGTLRFLALAVLQLDTEDEGVLCLEEPENGIHPGRIRVMLNLLQDMTTDAEEPLGEDNPLRQVIINTHSPFVVQEVPDESLVVAKLIDAVDEQGQRYKKVVFGALPDTWRVDKGNADAVEKGELLSYLGSDLEDGSAANGHPRRVKDRPDIREIRQLTLLDFADQG